MHRIRRKAPAIPSTQSLPSRILQLYFITGKANRIPLPLNIDLMQNTRPYDAGPELLSLPLGNIVLGWCAGTEVGCDWSRHQ